MGTGVHGMMGPARNHADQDPCHGPENVMTLPLKMEARTVSDKTQRLLTATSEAVPVNFFYHADSYTLTIISTLVCLPFFTVDGNWGPWNDGQCSKSCGPGSLSRTRECNDPAPQNGGQNCVGQDTEVVDCNLIACPSELA